MRQHGSVTHWIHEIKEGNREVAQQLWQRYFRYLVVVARKELRQSSRRVADEDDVVSEVFEKFFRAAESGRFPDLSDRDGLWRLLVQMTARKAVDQKRKHLRQRRGGGKIRGESVFINSSDDYENAIAQVIGQQPTPEFAVEMAEQVSALLDLLEDPELRQLTLEKLEGYTNEEIAEKRNCSSRTIERRLKLIRTKLNESNLEPEH